MKKKLSLLLTCILLCVSMAMPVYAAEPTGTPENEVVALATSSNYFSKITPKLNSLAGALPASANLSSGSCYGTNRSITSVTVNCRVSSGSSPFTLTITAPDGTTQSMTCGTSSTTYTFTGFNTLDPYGTWNIKVKTNGAVSTVTATLKVNYNYN